MITLQAHFTGERHKQSWLEPELYNHLLAHAYSQASDVYALGYLFKALYEFWKKSQELWMGGITEDTTIMDSIQYKVKNWMTLWDLEERKSMLQVVEFFRSLKTEPTRAQRPLVELYISFYPM